MQSKTTTNPLISQLLIPGMESMAGVKFFKITETRQVKFFNRGVAHSFNELSPKIYAALVNSFYKTNAAAKNTQPGQFKRALELFVFKALTNNNAAKPTLTSQVLSSNLTNIATKWS